MIREGRHYKYDKNCKYCLLVRMRGEKYEIVQIGRR